MKGRPLITAIENENLEITKILLENGADPNIDSGTPLSKALTISNPKEIVELLLSYNIEINHAHLINSYGEIKKMLLDYIVAQIDENNQLYFDLYKDMLKKDYVKEPYHSMYDYLDEFEHYAKTFTE